MKLQPLRSSDTSSGSILIIVLWVALGLVSIALYFAHSMSMELRSSDNRVAAIQSEQAIEGAAKYVIMVLSNNLTPGFTPDPLSYKSEAIPVGDAQFWLIGRDTNLVPANPNQMTFGLVDEASKLNLNTATEPMLEALPNMTPQLAAAIIDWRDTDSNVGTNGAESPSYALLQPPYACKNTNFETIDELRLVYGMNLQMLYGEDANLNGVLDANEDDADVLPPTDNHDGKLDAGILDYVTVYSREATNTSNGIARVNVANAGAVQRLISTNFPGKNLRQITATDSVLASYVALVKTLRVLNADQFAQIEPLLMNTNTVGLVNANTASVAVLTCIPGIGTNNAVTLINYRNTNPDKLYSIGWVADALSSDQNAVLKAGPYLTVRSYQYTADIAAVGAHGRGYRRVKFVFDTSNGAPTILYRQDLTHLGWALGKDTRDQVLLAKDFQ